MTRKEFLASLAGLVGYNVLPAPPAIAGLPSYPLKPDALPRYDFINGTWIERPFYEADGAPSFMYENAVYDEVYLMRKNAFDQRIAASWEDEDEDMSEFTLL